MLRCLHNEDDIEQNERGTCDIELNEIEKDSDENETLTFDLDYINIYTSIMALNPNLLEEIDAPRFKMLKMRV